MNLDLNQTEADALFQLLYFREYPTNTVPIIALEDLRGRVEQAINDRAGV